MDNMDNFSTEVNKFY